MSVPSDEVLEAELREAIQSQNIEELSLKRLRAQLEVKLQVDLSSKKQFVKDTVTRLLSEGQDEEGDEEDDNEEEEEEEESGEDEEEREETPSEHDTSDEDSDAGAEEDERNKGKKRKGSPTASVGGSAARNDGEMKGKHQLSLELQAFLGCKDPFMKRGDVTKELWKYIKDNDLQDPKDRRKILNDERMTKIFKCKTMNMMQIARKLSSHMKKYSDLVTTDDDLGHSPPPAVTKSKKAKVVAGAKSKSKKATAASSKGTKGAGKGGKGGKEEKEKKPRQPSRIKWKVSPQLAEVVGAGSDELTFDAIRAGVNKYIKDHNLQDPQNKRTIHCDPTLQRIMGKPTVDMFGMQTLYSSHRLHKIS